MKRWLVLLALASCVSREKQQSQHVLAAIEQLRDSDGGTRESYLGKLEAMKSDLPVAEKARVACAAAYRALSNAQRLIKQAQNAEPGKLRLDAAQAELVKARAGIEDCTGATGELRRWLKKN